MGRIDGDGERGGPVVGIEAVAAAEELAEGGFDRGQPFVEFDEPDVFVEEAAINSKPRSKSKLLVSD